PPRVALLGVRRPGVRGRGGADEGDPQVHQDVASIDRLTSWMAELAARGTEARGPSRATPSLGPSAAGPIPVPFDRAGTPVAALSSLSSARPSSPIVGSA